jgi:hypothetical protein
MRVAERSAQRLLAIDEDEMDVVRHEAIGPDGDALLTALARQQFAIELIVFFAEEHALAPIAPLRHMVGRPGTINRAMRAMGSSESRRQRRG